MEFTEKERYVETKREIELNMHDFLALVHGRELENDDVRITLPETERIAALSSLEKMNE